MVFFRGDKPCFRQSVIIAPGIHGEPHSELLHISGTAGGHCLFTGFVQSGKKHSGENCDNCDHDQKFNQGKTLFVHS